MSTNEVLLFFSLGLVVLWTVRLARSKARNPWLWGGASLLLMLIPNYDLLGMIPMAVLLFLKGPRASRDESIQGDLECPRCQTHHLARYNYCINCGWELRVPYGEATTARAEESFNNVAPVQPLDLSPIPRQEPPPAPQSVPEAAATEPEQPQADPEPAAGPTPQPPEVPEVLPEVPPGAPPEAPKEAPVRPTPTFRRPLAPNMTERGLALFHQGRFQEAIDQFTKAIALDPNYKPAWAHRAEAYDRLGRQKEAAEDMRRLEAI